MESIYEMKLHEKCQVNDSCWVTRVPGGWIYDAATSVFVPWNNEFQPVNTSKQD